MKGSEAIRGPAVGCIAWLGVIGCFANNATPNEVLHLIRSRGLQSNLLHLRIPIFDGFAHPVGICHPHGTYMPNPEFYLLGRDGLASREDVRKLHKHPSQRLVDGSTGL